MAADAGLRPRCFPVAVGPARLHSAFAFISAMQVPQSKILIVLAPIICACLVICAALLSGPGVYVRWHNLKDGMSQAEVRQLLGAPTWTGKGECTGAGGKPVVRWEYRVKLPGRTVYYRVDFDYIGPGGSAVVFRTERFLPERDWPWWCPWAAKARA